MKNTKVITPGSSNVTWNGIYAYIYKASKNNIFLNDAIESYIENLQHSCASNTLYCYSSDLHHLLEKVGNIKLSSISEEILQDCIDQIKNCGIKKPVHSASTMNRVKSVYRSFF